MESWLRRMWVVSCLLATALLIAACGGSTSHTSTAHGATGAARAYARTAPAQILRDAQRAMSAAGSFQTTGQVDLGGARAQATIGVQTPANVAASISTDGELVRLIALGSSASYLYANATFWKREFGAKATASVLKGFTNRWFRTPAATSSTLVKDLGGITPRQLAICLGQAANRPTVAGTPSVDGQATVELHFSSGRPGASPGNLYVAATAPHYPVRFEQTGVAQPGGSSACANGPTDSDNGKGRLDFAKWNAVLITAPAGAVALPGS